MIRMAGAVLGGTAIVVLAGCSAAAQAPRQHSSSAPAQATTGTAQDTSTSTGVVTGRFQRVGGPLGPGGQGPAVVRLSGTLRFSLSKQHWTDVHVGKSGTFRVTLAPGTYTVRGRTPQILEQLASGKARETWCGPAMTVTVRAGATKHLAVVCPVP